MTKTSNFAYKHGKPITSAYKINQILRKPVELGQRGKLVFPRANPSLNPIQNHHQSKPLIFPPNRRRSTGSTARSTETRRRGRSDTEKQRKQARQQRDLEKATTWSDGEESADRAGESGGALCAAVNPRSGLGFGGGGEGRRSAGERKTRVCVRRREAAFKGGAVPAVWTSRGCHHPHG